MSQLALKNTDGIIVEVGDSLKYDNGDTWLVEFISSGYVDMTKGDESRTILIKDINSLNKKKFAVVKV